MLVVLVHVQIHAFVLDVWISIICSRQWGWLLRGVSGSLKGPWREAGGFKGSGHWLGDVRSPERDSAASLSANTDPVSVPEEMNVCAQLRCGPRSLPRQMRRCRSEVGWRYGCGEAGLTCRVTCLFLPEGLLEFPLLGACWAQPLISGAGSFN